MERKLLYVLIAVPWFFTDSREIKIHGYRKRQTSDSLNWKEFSLRINLSISRTETRNVQFFTFVFSIKFIKSVAYLRCGLCDYDISCSYVPYQQKRKFFLLDHLVSHKFKEVTS